MKTYIARPQGDAIEKKAVIVISDVFGVSHNSMLLADDFAANGYLALLPDLLEGENLPLDVFETGSVDIPSWAARHSPTQVDPILDRIVKYLRSNQSIERIAGAGYCFGGKVRSI